MPSPPDWSIHHHGDTACSMSNLQACLPWQLPFLQHALTVVMQQSGNSIFHDRDTPI